MVPSPPAKHATDETRESKVFTTVPYTADLTYPSHLFRALLLRRLRLPLSLHVPVDQGHFEAEAFTPLERAAARVCREAGARVSTHTLISDLNIPTVHRIDNRRIEVIANGLPLWGGSQLAIDTTIVSPLTSQAAPGNTEDKTQARHYGMREGPKNGNLSIQVAAAWSFLE